MKRSTTHWVVLLSSHSALGAGAHIILAATGTHALLVLVIALERAIWEISDDAAAYLERKRPVRTVCSKACALARRAFATIGDGYRAINRVS